MTTTPPLTDADAFVTLVETHGRPLRKVCWAYGRTPDDRDDLFQEIVTRLWAAYPSYDRRRPFATWMVRVALNVAIDHGRKARLRRSDVLVAEPVSPRDGADATAELRELLDRLDDADRALLTLVLEGYSHREIGDVLGTSESNVGTRLFRIKASLRDADPTDPPGRPTP